MIEQRDSWTLHIASKNTLSSKVSSVVASFDPSVIVSETIAFAKLHRLNAQQIVLGVASESVLFALLPADESVNVKNGQSLRFALESMLPIDAECIVADSLERLDKGTSVGISAVAMETAHLKPLLDALEGSKFKVQFIVPISMLVFEQAVSDRVLPTPSTSIWGLDGITKSNSEEMLSEILVIDSNGSVVAWRVTDGDEASIKRNLLQLESESDAVLTLGKRGLLTSLSHDDSSPGRFIEVDAIELARKRASKLLLGHADPWFDLRRDELASYDRWRRYRTAIKRLALASCLLIGIVSASLFWRASLYQASANAFGQKQKDLFQNAFPGQRVPATVLTRLKSEYAKAIGIRKTDTSSTVSKPALPILQRAIESLPEAFPFEVDEIRIENGRLAIEIKLTSQEDVGKIAAGLATRGFKVQPPATNLTEGDYILASIDAMIDSDFKEKE